METCAGECVCLSSTSTDKEDGKENGLRVSFAWLDERFFQNRAAGRDREGFASLGLKWKQRGNKKTGFRHLELLPGNKLVSCDVEVQFVRKLIVSSCIRSELTVCNATILIFVLSTSYYAQKITSNHFFLPKVVRLVGRSTPTVSHR